MLAPTLIVGLGGTGSKIVSRVFKLASEEERSRIGFVVFDTDINELRDIKNEFPSMQTVQTSTKLTVGEYLNIDTHARDNWFPVHRILNAKSLTEGAGQVRAVSRLALETAIRAGKMEPLHKAIEDLYKLDGTAQSQALRVIIVSSLAGGTGSGILLPVALYIRHFLAEKFQQSASIVRGFFILPEVFFEVIRGNSERNNLKCNAYATIRELDAFLMKGDDSLPEKYRNKLKMEFPRPGTSLYDEYDVMPYDFCFLFDAQNVNGEKLNNFDQYLQHAASCIYSQSISPINKRSNSSEDNVIRELCRAGGRNRFCGAGTSIIKYPYEDVVDYLSLKWASECLSNQWTKFDKLFVKKKLDEKKKRERGISSQEVVRSSEYINDVISQSNAKDKFSKYIVESCQPKDSNGLALKGYFWENYIENLDGYIENNQDIETLDESFVNCNKKVNKLKNDKKGKDYKNYSMAYNDIMNYRKMVDILTVSKAESDSFSLFEDEDYNILDKQKFRLETYLFDQDGEFMHPNAVRFFLYNLASNMKKNIVSLKEDLKGKEEYIDGFAKRNFKGKDVYALGQSDCCPKKTILADNLHKLLTNVNQYRKLCVQKTIYDHAVAYVDSLSEGYEKLFATFENSMGGINKKTAKIRDKYKNRKGDTTRYVCASSKCLDAFDNKYPFLGSGMKLDSDLSMDIFNRIKGYSLKTTKPDADSYFRGIFDEGILVSFRDTLLNNYKSEIDIDVISALELEAEFEHQKYDEKEKTYYAKNVIAQTKKLSSPFIESPLGEERPPLDSCAYNPSLDNKEDPARHELVSSELKDFGGVPDTDIDKNMIMFYRAIYGLRANDLSKFAPPKESETVRPNAGEYFKAYFDLISQITPKSQDTPVITPHIDRVWHIIENMPDLDEDHQKLIENHIYTAFVSGLVMGKIKRRVVSKTRTEYTLSLLNEGDDMMDEFVVSNKTPCDKFYEVLNAITINPIVTGKILKSVALDYEAESLQNSKPLFEDSKFGKNLAEMKFSEFAVIDAEGKESCASIIDIALLLALSTPSDDFEINQGIAVLKTAFRILEEYIQRITSKDLFLEKYGEVVYSQYKLFKNNLNYYENDKKFGLDNYGLYITKIFENIARELYRAEMIKEAEEVQKENDERNRRLMEERPKDQ